MMPLPPAATRRSSLPTPKSYAQFVEKTVDPQAEIDLILGRPRLLVFKEAPRRLQIGGDAKNEIADYVIITEKEISLLGKAVGNTVLNLWFTDPKDANKQVILSYLVRVFPDTEAVEQARDHLRELRQRFYKALEAEINRAFPDSLVCLSLVGSNLVVAGQAKDGAEAAHILEIVQANSPRARGAGGTATGAATLTRTATEFGLTGARSESVREPIPPEGTVPEPVGEPFGGPGRDATGLDLFAAADALRSAGAGRNDIGISVVSLLRVPGEQQVMLRVTVAEVDRAAARSIGVNFSIMNHSGMTVFANNTGNIASATGGGTGTGSGLASGIGSVANLPLVLDNGQITAAVNALRTLDFARTLAEPNLVTLNGQPANFRAGGEFPVPVVTGYTAAGLQGVSFVPFGVQLSFTPYITDKDRIRLSVKADVSTKDLASSANVGGTNVPGLNSRNFQTTVELREGQTLAVAGLIQNNFGADATRVPFFGDLPFLGRFFAFDRTSAGEQELVVLVTPELVHPVEAKDTPPLPGSDVFEPGDLEFYLLGRLESRRTYDYRSPARTDIDRMARYRHCDQLFMIGPAGHSGQNPNP